MGIVAAQVAGQNMLNILSVHRKLLSVLYFLYAAVHQGFAFVCALETELWPSTSPMHIGSPKATASATYETQKHQSPPHHGAAARVRPDEVFKSHFAGRARTRTYSRPSVVPENPRAVANCLLAYFSRKDRRKHRVSFCHHPSIHPRRGRGSIDHRNGDGPGGAAGPGAGAAGSGGAGRLPPVAPLRHPPPAHPHRHRPQRHRPEALGRRHDGQHGEERRAGRADSAEQHHGVDGAGHHGHHARLGHQRLHRRHVPGPGLAVQGGGAAWPGVREQGPGGVRRQVPGRVALLHARLRLQRAGHPAVRARQLPPRRPAARARRRDARGVRGVRGADGEPRQLRLVARPARLLRLPRALPLDVRPHPHAGLHRSHVRAALLPRHHQRPWAPPGYLRKGSCRRLISHCQESERLLLLLLFY